MWNINGRYCCIRALLILVAGTLFFVTTAAAQNMLPAGLSSNDPEVRKQAVQDVCKNKMMMAERKIAAMAKTDPNPGVREVACLGLADMGAYSQVDALQSIAANDINSDVRAAAAKSALALGGNAGPSNAPPEEQTAQSYQDDNYKKPELSTQHDEPVTRLFAVGFGSMGGYGLASMTLRGRIPTGSAGLPSIGLELGGGWTPPDMYQFVAGPIAGENGDSLSFDPDKEWMIISVAGAVLLHFHRMHYVPIRAGWDIGRGAYTMLGYGFEHLNQEGFFSWGLEIGMLVQPVINDHIGDLVVNAVKEDIWKVIPYIRFSLHFYLA